MEQFKRAQVIMLPTEENRPNIWLKNNNILVYSNHITKSNAYCSTGNWQGQHLYIISDDEIKEGDWFIHHSHGITTLLKAIEVKDRILDNEGTSCCKSYCKKIIATTDTSLKIEIDGNKGDLLPDVSFDINLPQPSQQFIEKYIEEYNKGNIITDILVEYEKINIGSYINIVKRNFIEIPKINSKDNTITIKKLKDSWNREELTQILFQLKKDIINNHQAQITNVDINDWINKNL